MGFNSGFKGLKATLRVVAAKVTRLTQKIAIQGHLVVEIYNYLLLSFLAAGSVPLDRPSNYVQHLCGVFSFSRQVHRL